MTLDEMWKLMLAKGGLPNEVIINRDGTKLPAEIAVKKDFQWDVIYFREDGYTCAADYYLAPYVRDAEHKWIGKIYRGCQNREPLTKLEMCDITIDMRWVM